MPHSQPKTSTAKVPGSSHSPNPSCAELDALFDERFGERQASPLALIDQIDAIKDAQQAYEALELLVTPIMAADCEKLELSRSQLGCLLRALNLSMREQIVVTQELVNAAREAA